MEKKEIRKKIRLFLERVENKLGRPDKVILFGSYAKGGADDSSDIDLLIISNKFAKMSRKKRFDLLYELSKGIYPDINAFGFTQKEIKASKSRILKEALAHGKVLKN